MLQTYGSTSTPTAARDSVRASPDVATGSLKNLYMAFGLIATGGLLFGYIIGLNSDMITEGQLICADWTRDARLGSWRSFGYQQCYNLDSLAMGFLSSLNIIGATLSSLFCFRFADSMGRKLEVQIGASCYLMGAGFAAIAPSLAGITAGLSLYGVGIGFAMHAAPVYIAEISPPNLRGTLVSAKEAVIVLGMFLGYFFGFLFSGIELHGWRFGILMPCVFAAIMLLGIKAIPESPRFLVLQAARKGLIVDSDARTIDEARAALKFFRDTPSAQDIEEELQSMIADAQISVDAAGANAGDVRHYPFPLMIGCGLVFLQQVTGQPSVLYFATNIFKMAGMGSTAAFSSVVVGLCKLVATLLTVWKVDRYGRRLLLFIGIGLMALALAIVATAFLYQECQTEGVSVYDCNSSEKTLPKAWAVATVVALMLYVSGYQIGFGPIVWCVISEIFPLNVRGAALSVAAMVNFTSNIMMTLTQQVLIDALGPSGLFSGYFILCIVSLIFVNAVLPETNGKTLEEIEAMMTGHRK